MSMPRVAIFSLLCLAVVLIFTGSPIRADEIPEHRYLMSEKAAREMLLMLYPGARFSVKAFSQEFGFAPSGIYRMTNEETREEFTVSAGRWMITNYRNRAAWDDARAKARQKVPTPDQQQTRDTAVRNGRLLVKRMCSSWPADEMEAVASITFPMMFFLVERLPGEQRYRGNSCLFYASPYDGTILSADLQPYSPVIGDFGSLSVDRTKAQALAEVYVRKHQGKGWTLGVDWEKDSGFADSGELLAPRTDAFGIPRLTHLFIFERPSTGCRCGLPADECICPEKETICLSVDATDGTVLPEGVMTDDTDGWGVKPIVYLDERQARFSYPPIIRNNEPYLYMHYLRTRLWPGEITSSENGYRVKYGRRIAELTPKSVIVREDENVVYKGKPLLVIGGRPYVHYRVIAALTGDEIQWKRRSQSLEIATK